MRYLPAAILAALALAAPAQARQPRMTFRYATAVAIDYWAKRDIKVPCQPQHDFLTYKQTEGWDMSQRMFADTTNCTVDITPWADLRDDRDMGWMFCQEIVHEVGHLAGLDHDYGGVMAAEPTVVPWGCDHQRRFQRDHYGPQNLGRGVLLQNYRTGV